VSRNRPWLLLSHSVKYYIFLYWALRNVNSLRNVIKYSTDQSITYPNPACNIYVREPTRH